MEFTPPLKSVKVSSPRELLGFTVESEQVNGEWVVSEVNPGGVAGEFDIRRQDRLARINGKSPPLTYVDMSTQLSELRPIVVEFAPPYKYSNSISQRCCVASACSEERNKN
eukprot:TRINITY_DN3209_c0_g1_i1.p1 TRINITY_DN3209_c0_g1~~TRINITY_DN3209_c0_g1_i1.p1  ORF type:complete len:111 (-),score=15.97 TRINITY_DN3209_c0_g1_i1:188-520(-)